MILRRLVYIDGQPCVQVYETGPLSDGEVDIDVSEFAAGSDRIAVARTTTPTMDEVALEDLLSRCRGGGAVGERAVTGVPTEPRKDRGR